jgi:hypothetical protein
MHRGSATRVGVEAYPALAARKVLGRESYKTDPRGRPRTAVRARLLEALRDGALRTAYGYRIELRGADAQALVESPDADGLDAVLAALQSAWSAAMPGHGLPRRFDALEGWIADPETLR